MMFERTGPEEAWRPAWAGGVKKNFKNCQNLGLFGALKLVKAMHLLTLAY